MTFEELQSLARFATEAGGVAGAQMVLSGAAHRHFRGLELDEAKRAIDDYIDAMVNGDPSSEREEP